MNIFYPKIFILLNLPTLECEEFSINSEFPPESEEGPEFDKWMCMQWDVINLFYPKIFILYLHDNKKYNWRYYQCL